MKQKKIEELRVIISSKNIQKESFNTNLFGGTDISIVTKLPDKKSDFYGDPQYVVTKYAKELSWLVFQLKEIFKEDLDYINKYPFYGRLAESANMSITLKGGELKDLLFDVLDEAEKMSEETNEKH